MAALLDWVRLVAVAQSALFANLSPTADGADTRQIQAAEAALGIRLPDDYRAFLRWSNGWEGWLGNGYVQLAPADQLLAANDSAFRQANPGLIAIGGDGGLETFALDYRAGTDPSGLVALDTVAGLDSVLWIGPTFTAALSRLAANPDGPFTALDQRRSAVTDSDLPTTIGKVARRELALDGITHYEQLAERSERELLAIHGVGPKAIRVLRDELRSRGLGFRGD